MTILSSKWVLVLIGLAVVLIVMYLLGRKSVHAELVIPATPAEVWSVLMDTEGFVNWNQVLVPIEGEFREGGKLTYRMSQPDGKTSEVQATVKKLIKENKLNQCGGIPGIMTFSHTWLLEPVENGTKVTQHEEYRGIYVLFWDPSWYQSAYQSALDALKERVFDLRHKDE